MKPRHYFLISLTLVIAAIAFIKSNQAPIKLPPNSVTQTKPAISAISYTATPDDSLLEAPSQQTPSSLIPPCDQISDEELAEFPGATLVEAGEGRGPKPDETLQVRILKTNFKDPYVRTEEIFDNNTGNVIGRREMAADHLLAVLPNEINLSDFYNQLAASGFSLTYVTSRIVNIKAPSSSSPSISSLSKILRNLQRNGFAVEPDYIIQENEIANASSVTTQWGILPSDGGVDAVDAWTICSGAPSIIIALIDSGIRYKHSDLVMNMWHNNASTFGDFYGINAYAGNGDPMDDNGHGTHCAGTIGSSNQNGLGVKGIAQKTQLMACKFMNADGVGSTTDAITCIDYAINHGAKILNCSWGASNPTMSLYQELKEAQLQGVIVVAAAGNTAINDDETPFYPASFHTTTVGPDGHIYPALDNIVSVAATAPGDDFAFFSNYGPTTVEIAAPGLNILSTYNDSDTSYAIMSGTSMAAPYITGALALIETHYPGSYTAAISRLLNTTDSLPILSGRTSAGRLNIFKALSAH